MRISQETNGTDAEGVRFKIERGQRGGYGWELSVSLHRDEDATFDDLIRAATRLLDQADAAMRRRFGAPVE